MALSNRQRVQGAQDTLLEELVVYVERALRGSFGENWVTRVTAEFHGIPIDGVGKPQWDISLLVKTMAKFWYDAFSQKLTQTDRNNLFELKDWRNALAHDQPFTYDDTYRALDTMYRLAESMGFEAAGIIEKQRDDVMRVKLREKERSISRSINRVDGQVPAGLKPWREVILPHKDVREGKFQSAEFAADLNQVHKGEAAPEYGEPQAFFERTFITSGLRDLLTNALTRLSGGEGDPVVELQTNFGGGKTHSMLALYHLFGDVPSSNLPGLEEVHTKAGVSTAPAGVKRAVLVGNALGTTQRMQKDGTVTNTIWGELAYQLAGETGFALIAQADEQRVNPGTDNLIRLLKLASPCLILIDEWVSHLRELYGREDVKAGSFESNISFAQSLTEAAKAVPTALVVASLPQSQSEVAGEGGSAALDALKQTFKRVQSTWLPANPEESFEIVRRRLFEPISGDSHRQLDAVVKAFTDHYAANKSDYPPSSSEPDFARRLRSSYPIHPILFDDLFGAWSTLERFQRTRGVLRLMAMVIHRLWQDGERNLMILPATLPIDDARVQAELRNYLGESWEAIINQEVDGPDSLPVQIEREDTRLVQYFAARRVARSVFMATAPKAGTAQAGIDTRAVFLRSIQPGEVVGPFSDALRRISQQSVYLYSDDSQYWFSTRPSLNRRAADLAASLSDDQVHHEIEERLKDYAAAKYRGPFAGVHVTADSANIPDESDRPAVRLALLPAEFPHTRGAEESPALRKAHELVTRRGGADRMGRNNVVVVAADKVRLEDLNARTRDYLAWQKIHAEADSSDLTPSDKRQADSKKRELDKTVKAQIEAAYSFLLTPTLNQQVSPPTVEFDEERLGSDGHLVERVIKKLAMSEGLMKQFSGVRLDMRLKSTLWNDKQHLEIKQLLSYFAQYLYLERLTSAEVLLAGIQDGVAANEPYFGFADAYRDGRYLNLKFGEDAQVRADDMAVLVHPMAARVQKANDLASETSETRIQAPSIASANAQADQAANPTCDTEAGGTTTAHPSDRSAQQPLTHVFAEGELSDTRMVKHFQTIYEEMVQLILDAGGKASVTITLRGDITSGMTDSTQRNLTENARNLRMEIQLE